MRRQENDEEHSKQILFLSRTCERRNKTCEIYRCLDKKKYEKEAITMKGPKVDSYIPTYKLFDTLMSRVPYSDHSFFCISSHVLKEVVI